MRSPLVIGLLSSTLIALEIVWTRIFAANFYYTFAFLIISLAILGLGLGALALRLFPWLNRERHMGWLLCLTALAALLAPAACLRLGLAFGAVSQSVLGALRLIAVLALVGLPFFTGGIVLAHLFRRDHREMPRLYMADLLGAGAGVLIAGMGMQFLQTPITAFFVCIPVLLAAWLSARRMRAAVVGLAVILAMGWSYADEALDPPREDRAPVIHKHWDGMGKIKIYDYDPDYRGLNIDSAANSPVYRFDGNWDRPDSMRFEFGIPVKNLIARFDECSFLSLGSGGGTDVLQALQEGVVEAHAVEVNPAINRMMLDGFLTQFSGELYYDPRVTVATEDARSYVRRYEDYFDIIYSLSSNTFAALASGSFALAEDYLFTTEAFEDYYRALSPNGFMMMEHQFYMPRLASELIDALENSKVESPRAHFAIYDLPKMRRNMVLLSKAPLTEEIRQNAFGELTAENYGDIHLLYPAPDSTASNLVNRIVLDGWKAAQDSATIALSPCTDDRPFTAQLGLWRNVDRAALTAPYPFEFRGYPASRVILVAILAIALVLAAPLLALPRLRGGPTLEFTPAAYFFAIGIAFIGLELVLLQRATLFIGAAAHTFSTILLALLVGSGIGSRFSARVSDRVPFIGILVWILAELSLFPVLRGALVGLPLAGRTAVSFVLLLPLGFFMGMPFPKAARYVGELVDWGFAVTGVASVIGSTTVLLFCYRFGIRLSLLMMALCYSFAFGLLLRMAAAHHDRTQRPSHATPLADAGLAPSGKGLPVDAPPEEAYL